MRGEVKPFDPWYFFIVQLYGCDLDSPLRPYLDFVGSRIDQEARGTVILCGGPTQQKRFPGKTEAGVAGRYLTERAIKEGRHLPVLMPKDRSFTTEENVRDACAYIRGIPGIDEHWHEVKVRAFCETQRALQSMGFYWDLLPEIRQHHGRVWMETYNWELAHPDIQLAKANRARLSRRFPLVGRAFGAWRRFRARFR